MSNWKCIFEIMDIWCGNFDINLRLSFELKHFGDKIIKMFGTLEMNEKKEEIDCVFSELEQENMKSSISSESNILLFDNLTYNFNRSDPDFHKYLISTTLFMKIVDGIVIDNCTMEYKYDPVFCNRISGTLMGIEENETSDYTKFIKTGNFVIKINE